MDILDKTPFESMSMDCPLVRGFSPVRPRSVHTHGYENECFLQLVGILDIGILELAVVLAPQ